MPGVDLDEYQDALVARFRSPTVPDTLARLATSSSDRLPRFVGPVLGAEAPAAAAVIACWLRWTETHPGDVVDRRPPSTREQMLADCTLFTNPGEAIDLVLSALALLRRRPVTQALEELTTAAMATNGRSGAADVS